MDGNLIKSALAADQPDAVVQGWLFTLVRDLDGDFWINSSNARRLVHWKIRISFN